MTIELSEARTIAADWHSGQWSALYSFASTGTIRSDLVGEVETIVRECENRVATGNRVGNHADPAELLEDAQQLLEFVTQPITSVWSAYGHTFMSDGDGYESCLTCGAQYELVHDEPEDPSHGAYVASNGDEPVRCQGTGAEHGEDRAEDDHACNCVLCDN